MSSSTATLKRHNHRVHPCKDEKKEELLKFLLTKNSDKKIIVVTSKKSELTTEQEDVTILSDEELINQPELRCDMIISYDLPSKAIKYMARIDRTDTYALILVNPSEEKVIHPIETLIGRTIMQESVEGFSEVREEKQAQPTKKDANPREDRKKEFLSRDEKPKREFKEKKPYSNDNKGERKPWEKKEKKENKYLGKDEDGKAIFSGKSGERNHSYDGTPKARAPKLTGKKISIKTLKKKEESE
ncbi:hypothetical protein [Sulfurimonas sp.]